MQADDRVIEQFHRHITQAVRARALVLATAAWCFAWGVIVLVARMTTDLPRATLLWFVVGLVPFAAIALWRTRSSIPSLDTLRTALDHDQQLGGLLMASAQTDLGAWRDRLQPLRAPIVRWQFGSSLGLAVLAVLFVAAAFALPKNLVQPLATAPLQIQSQVQELTEQLKVLEEEKLLASDTAADLQKKLAQLQQNADGRDPVKTWDALDHMNSTLDRTAEKAAEQNIARTEKLSQAQSLADALQQAGQSLDAATTTQAMQDLANMVREAAQDSAQAGAQAGELAQDLAKLAQAMQNQQLSPEQMRKLSEALKQAKGDIRQQMQRLQQARLIDPRTLSQCEKAGQCDGPGQLAELLERQGDLLLREANGKPGSGGISRGRGDADLNFTGQTDDDGKRFDPQALPPASLQALRDSQLTGVSRGAPQVDTQSGASAGGALQQTRAGGGSAKRQEILPRHQASVRRYFDRNADGSGSSSSNSTNTPTESPAPKP